MTRYGRDESEWLTRKLSIDPKLKSWGWTVIPFESATLADQRGCYAIAEYPSANGPADYALVVNGRVLGIVEAKKLTLGPQGVLTQAERYARGLPVGRGTLLEYFRQATSITADPPDRPARTIVEVIEDIWANRDRPYNIRCLVKRLQRTRRCPPRPAGSSPGSFLTAISPATPRACLLHWTTTSPTR
jgi:hypothetical protein